MGQTNPLDREIELEKRGILADRESTNYKTNAFIEEIRGGLGEDIKSNPNGVKITPKPKPKKKNKFIEFIKNIFLKF